MKVLEYSHRYGMMQFTKKFEWWLIGACGLIVAVCVLVVLLAGPAEAGCNCSRAESADGLSSGEMADRFDAQYKAARAKGLPAWWSGFFAVRSGINAETAYVSVGYEEGGSFGTWHEASARFPDGHREAGVVNSRGEFATNEPRINNGSGRLGGPV